MGHQLDGLDYIARGKDAFMPRLHNETHLLQTWFEQGKFDNAALRGGVEIEFWLHDKQHTLNTDNVAFIQGLTQYNISPEVINCCAELNSDHYALSGDALTQLNANITQQWELCQQAATGQQYRLLLAGTPLIATPADFTRDALTPLTRYQELNNRVIQLHDDSYSHIDIHGKDTLSLRTQELMLAGATASLQLHLQVPFKHAVTYHNIAQLISAPLLAACGNSPFLFGRQLWEETRIPLFEKTLTIYNRTRRREICRSLFGDDYLQSFMQLFWENYYDFPLWIDYVRDLPEHDLWHLRLHNGTIYRWNRPILGFDSEGNPHLRIENRILSTGPTLIDMLANATFFFGLMQGLFIRYDCFSERLPFRFVRENFYRAAKHGLNTQLIWLDQQLLSIKKLILDSLLSIAADGLAALNIATDDATHYLAIIEARVRQQQTGSQWQQAFIKRHPNDFVGLADAYLQLQQANQPVHSWPKP